MLLACAVVGGVAVTWKLKTQPQQHLVGTPLGQQALPDGTILVLEQITSAGPHQLKIGESASFFHAMHLGRTSHTPRQCFAGTLDHAVVLWYSHWHASLPQTLDFDWWLASILVDPYGEEILDSQETSHLLKAKGGTASYGAARPWAPLTRAPDDILLATSQFPALRQPAGNRKLRVYDRQSQQIAEFEVPFPDTTATPQWQPDSLPVTKTDADLQVTFTAVEIEEQAPAGQLVSLMKNPRPRWRIAPVFSVLHHGQPGPAWKPDVTELTDALGNKSSLWNCSLSTHETAWKLELQLARDDPAAFSPAEQWESPTVALPAENGLQPVPAPDSSATAEISGVTLTLQEIGRGATTYHDLSTSSASAIQRSSGSRSVGNKTFSVGHSSSSYGNGTTTHSVQTTGDCVHLLVKMEHVPPNHRELFRVHDQQGRELAHAVESLTIGNVHYAFVFIDPDETVESVRLKVYVHTSRTVELYIAPPLSPART
ncbi:MAG: hypothetical protein JSS02_18575 [Planctomycetes bacterium]|nr:hypothetical protein [Planctomycetota bacterium]